MGLASRTVRLSVGWAVPTTIGCRMVGTAHPTFGREVRRQLAKSLSLTTMRGIAESVRCGDIRRRSKQNQSINRLILPGRNHTHAVGRLAAYKKQRVFEGERANENLFHVRHAECQGWIGPLCGVIQTEFATDGHGGSVFFPEFSGVFALSVPCASTGPVVSGTVIIPSLAHGCSRRTPSCGSFFVDGIS